MDPISSSFLMSGSGAAAINGGSSLLGGLLGGIFGNYAARKQYKYNSRLLNQQFDLQRQENDRAWSHDVEMWNMQNEYNSPTQQMERLRAAGLNPNLIYGSTDGGTASGSPTYHPAQVGRVDPPDLMQGIMPVLQAVSQMGQLGTIYSQAEYQRAMTLNTLADVANKTHDSTFKSIRNSYAEQFFKNQADEGAWKVSLAQKRVDQLIANTNLTKKRVEIADQELSKIMRENLIGDETADFQFQVIQFQLFNLVADFRNKLLDGNIKQYMIDEKLPAEVRKILATAAQLESNPEGYVGETGNVVRGIRGLLSLIPTISEWAKKLIFD